VNRELLKDLGVLLAIFASPAVYGIALDLMLPTSAGFETITAWLIWSGMCLATAAAVFVYAWRKLRLWPLSTKIH
jgi:hypothetical protein